MEISIYGFGMAVVCSGITILLLYACRKRYGFIQKFGAPLVLAVYLLTIIRLLVPLRFPWQLRIPLPWLLNPFYYFVDRQMFSVDTYVVQGEMVFGVVWMVGALLFLVRWFLQYRNSQRTLLQMNCRQTEQEIKLLEQIRIQSQRKLRAEVWRNSYISIPMGMGVFRKMILLPEKEYTDEELYYILLHEYTHFRHGDTCTKMLLRIFCCIFWWNPFGKLLERDVDRILEINCDRSVTKEMSKASVVAYLETIIHTIKETDSQKGKMQTTVGTALFHQDANDEILERFQLLVKGQADEKNKGHRFHKGLVLLVILLLFSYTFEIQPSFEPPESDMEEGIELTRYNTFLIDYGDGTYDWIFKGEDGDERLEVLNTLDNLTHKEIVADMKKQKFPIVEGVLK